jgi:DNA-directed RNA polymerase specialized sigma24 family protein
MKPKRSLLERILSGELDDAIMFSDLDDDATDDDANPPSERFADESADTERDGLSRAVVAEALSSLPPRQRAVAALIARGHDLSSAARQLGISREAARQCFHRARQTLRGYFEA